MEKITQKFYEGCEYPDIGSFIEIQEAIDELQALKDKGITHIDYNILGDGDGFEQNHYSEREETDSELADRVRRISEAGMRVEIRDRENYIRLKAKYEPEAK